MKKHNRLRKNFEFNYCFKRGKRIFSKDLSCVFVSSKKEFPKVGFVVGKKIGGAVVRNRIKRQLREAFGFFFDNIKNYNFIILAKPEIVNCSFEEIKKQILELLKKAEVLKNEE